MKALWRAGMVALLLLLTVSTVSAHAKLIKTSPSPNSILGSAPAQVQLWFDEALDLNFSDVQVVNANKQRVDTGALLSVPDDPNSVIVPLKPSGDGSYNVIWKVLSATDGHITRGVFAYGVGDTAGEISASVDPNATAAPEELSPVSAVVRWASLLALLAAVGAFFFRVFFLERSLDAVNARHTIRTSATRRWRQLVAAALVVFFVGSFADLAVQSALIADEISFTSMVAVLAGSRFGALWLTRIGLMAVCALPVFLETRRVRVPYADYALIVLGNVALMTRSLNSHAAVSGNLSLPVFADWVHLLCVAIWVGGLCCMVWLAPFVWRALDPKARSAWIAWLVPQFSMVAIPATLILFVTGAYSAAQQMPALDLFTTGTLPALAQLTGDPYSNVLWLKVGLFVVMLGFGALNLVLLSPRFRRYVAQPAESARLFTRFRLTVGAEVLLGVSAIFLAGMLTLTVPPRSAPEPLAPVAPSRVQPPVVLLGYPAPNVLVHLQIGPEPNTPEVFDALVTDAAGGALPDVQRVIFNFMYLNEDTGAQNVNAEPRADQHYVANGQYLTLDGMWKIKVTVRQKGADDVAVEFPFHIAPRVPDSVAPVMAAQSDLVKAQQAMNALRTMRSTQELNDGTNAVTVSHYEYQAPDRTRFSIEGQGESIAVGAQQYYQDSAGHWIERARVEPFVFPQFDFADTAQATRAGRADKIDNAPAQIILFDTPGTSGDELIHYAYWLDANLRVRQFGMVAAGHYMMQYFRDFDAPDIVVEPPANAVPAPTIAPVSGDAGPLAAAVQGTGRAQGFITGDLEGDGALVMVVTGVVILLLGSGGRRTRSARIVTLGTGAAAVLLGIGLFVDAVNGTTSANQNVPVNATRALSGQAVYEQNCATCHGSKGFGDGPAGLKLPIKPFDLTTHVLLHDEQYLYAVILNGRGYMPAWGSKLTQEQLLDVIAYTRLLARNAQQAAPNATPARPGFTPQP